MKFSIKSLLVIATFAAVLLAVAFAWHRDRSAILQRLKQERARAQLKLEVAERERVVASLLRRKLEATKQQLEARVALGRQKAQQLNEQIEVQKREVIQQSEIIKSQEALALRQNEASTERIAELEAEVVRLRAMLRKREDGSLEPATATEDSATATED